MLIFTGINFAALTYFAVLPALILARTGGDEVALGTVQAMLGVGGVLGGLLVSLRGLPQRKIHAILAYAAISFLCGDLLFAVGRTTPVWMVAATIAAIFIPFIVAADRTIWQSKVAPAIQGRVFATHGALRNLSFSLGFCWPARWPMGSLNQGWRPAVRSFPSLAGGAQCRTGVA
ncbi:MAG: hypothetical protein R3C14_16765 [Caldilineaceae bacterium]